ncbi:G6PT3-like protein [Mya arenaria]|uniref:Sugar phosphate exchanger 3 n=1 Tax=Mya arenaria TaxID=6604 RepID=A0ABY7EAT6_MYAAR|nr:G6PT3-like protein [Mya arenaria]
MGREPLGIKCLPSISHGPSRNIAYKVFILVFTFFIYMSYHLSRKPISIVKSRLYRKNCSIPAVPVGERNGTECDWAPFDHDDNASTLLGSLDLAYLFAYAVGMFCSGHIAERMNLRYFLSLGMILSGAFTAAFGFGYFWNIHTLYFYIIVQILGGLVQSTGWPSVVTCVGNWYGKGKRGLIMGIWNSHTSVGNILGSLIAGIWVNTAWGWSFVVPGIIIASLEPSIVDCPEPPHEQGQVEPAEAEETEALIKKGNEADGPKRNEAVTIWRALSIPGVIEFSLCLFFAKLVSYTFLFWLPKYISNKGSFDAQKAGDLSTLMDVGGIFDVYIQCLWEHRHDTQRLLLALGFLVNGPYSLITTAVSADLGTHKSLKGNAKALATVTAVIDGTGSVGAAVGPLLAGVISNSNWNNVFWMLIASDIFAMVFLIRLVYKEIKLWRLVGCSQELDDVAIQIQKDNSL